MLFYRQAIARARPSRVSERKEIAMTNTTTAINQPSSVAKKTAKGWLKPALVAIVVLMVFAAGVGAKAGVDHLGRPAPTPLSAMIVAPTSDLIMPSADETDTCGVLTETAPVSLTKDGVVTTDGAQFQTIWSVETVVITVADMSGAQKTAGDIAAVLVRDKNGVLRGAKLSSDDQRAFKLVLLMSDWQSADDVSLCYK